MVLSVVPHAVYPEIINISGDNMNFLVTMSTGVSGRVDIIAESHDVDVWMGSGTFADIGHIRWSRMALGVDLGYDYSDNYTQENWAVTSTSQRFLRGTKRRNLFNTINLDALNYGGDPDMVVKASDSTHIFGTYTYFGTSHYARRTNYETSGTSTVATPVNYANLFCLSSSNVIGMYESSGTVRIDRIDFDAETVENVTIYTYPEGRFFTSSKQANEAKTIVWFTSHGDGSYPTYIYSHAFNLTTNSFYHGILYTFTDAEYYWDGTGNPSISERAIPSPIGNRMFWFPTILTSPNNTYSEDDHGVFSLIIMIDPTGYGNYSEHKFVTDYNLSAQITIENAVSAIDENKIYFFTSGWDEQAEGYKKFKLSTINVLGTVAHIKEWEDLDGNFPCVYLVGSRKEVYRVQRDGDVYKASDDSSIGNIGLLNLPSQTSGVVNFVFYNLDDVYERIYFTDATNGNGYLNCNNGTITRNADIVAGLFIGNRIIYLDGSDAAVMYTKVDDFTTDQNDYF